MEVQGCADIPKILCLFTCLGFMEVFAHVVLKQKNVQLVGLFPLPGGRLVEENSDGQSPVG